MKSDLMLEMKVLRSVSDGTPKMRGYILPMLRETHFSTATTAGLYKRMLKLHASTNEIPAWSELIHDPGVAKETRRAMRSMTVKPVKTDTRASSVLGTLERLRQVRALYQIGADLQDALEGGDSGAVDPQSVIETLQNNLSKVSKNAIDTVVTRIGGENPNGHLMAKKILMKGGMIRIPTGVVDFDSINAGFPKSGVVILSANTGGGKTTMLDNIVEYMAMQGGRVIKFPLENDAEESITKDMARITGESMTNLADPLKRIPIKRRQEMYKQYKAYQRKLVARGGCIDIVEPGFSSTVENLLAYADPLDYDVVVIDYVGLLDGVNGDDQWRAMSNAVAYAKKWAGRPNRKTLVIFAAQISEEGTLRQSKAMADHATNFWHWRVGDDERDSGIVEIFQGKCRGGKVFSFPQYVDFEHMTFRSLTKTEMEMWQLTKKEAKEGKKGKRNDNDNWKNKSNAKRGKKPDLDDDEDDDSANEVVYVKTKKIKPRDRNDNDNERVKPRRKVSNY